MSEIPENVAQTRQLAAEELRAEKLEKQNARMRELGNTTGFFQAYFASLKEYRTNVLAFEALNEEYFSLFGEYRYKDYQSFRGSQTYNLTKNR
jgi:hypothetical protein